MPKVAAIMAAPARPTPVASSAAVDRPSMPRDAPTRRAPSGGRPCLPCRPRRAEPAREGFSEALVPGRAPRPRDVAVRAEQHGPRGGGNVTGGGHRRVVGGGEEDPIAPAVERGGELRPG